MLRLEGHVGTLSTPPIHCTGQWVRSGGSSDLIQEHTILSDLRPKQALKFGPEPPYFPGCCPPTLFYKIQSPVAPRFLLRSGRVAPEACRGLGEVWRTQPRGRSWGRRCWRQGGQAGCCLHRETYKLTAAAGRMRARLQEGQAGVGKQWRRLRRQTLTGEASPGQRTG